MTLAEQALHGREFTTVLTPLTVYCYKCNLIMPTGTLAQKFDGATYTHETCPSTPLKNVAVHKY